MLTWYFQVSTSYVSFMGSVNNQLNFFKWGRGVQHNEDTSQTDKKWFAHSTAVRMINSGDYSGHLWYLPAAQITRLCSRHEMQVEWTSHSALGVGPDWHKRMKFHPLALLTTVKSMQGDDPKASYNEWGREMCPWEAQKNCIHFPIGKTSLRIS